MFQWLEHRAYDCVHVSDTVIHVTGVHSAIESSGDVTGKKLYQSLCLPWKTRVVGDRGAWYARATVGLP